MRSYIVKKNHIGSVVHTYISCYYTIKLIIIIIINLLFYKLLVT